MESNKLRLTSELVPSTCWYSNVRSNVSEDEWDIIRRRCYNEAKHKCEVCGDVGTNQGVWHSVECHEIWSYDDSEKTQVLIGLISLCPQCHKVKHSGLANIKNELDLVILQLMVVNGMTESEADQYLDEVFDIWEERSQHEWTLDITYLEEYMKPKPKSDNFWENY